jgi:hypothetical protein
MVPDQPPFVWSTRIWQAADKVVFHIADEVSSERTRSGGPRRGVGAEAEGRVDLDLVIGGPHLAAGDPRQTCRCYQPIVAPAIVGSGNPFFPDDQRVDLELLDERRFGDGVVYCVTASRIA